MEKYSGALWWQKCIFLLFIFYFSCTVSVCSGSQTFQLLTLKSTMPEICYSEYFWLTNDAIRPNKQNH